MGLCRTIATLAGQLELQIEDVQENHKNMIAVMKNMPSYLEQGDLSKWESDYREAIGQSEDELSINYRAIDLVYELAGLNLFGAFQASETKALYRHVVSELDKLRFKVSEDMNVEQW